MPFSFLSFLYSERLKSKRVWVSDPQQLFGFQTDRISDTIWKCQKSKPKFWCWDTEGCLKFELTKVQISKKFGFRSSDFRHLLYEKNSLWLQMILLRIADKTLLVSGPLSTTDIFPKLQTFKNFKRNLDILITIFIFVKICKFVVLCVLAKQ